MSYTSGVRTDFMPQPPSAAEKNSFLQNEAPAFVASAESVARNILNKKFDDIFVSSSDNRATCCHDVVCIHHHHYPYYPYGWGYGWGPSSYPSRRDRDDNDRAFRAFVLVVGSIFAGVAYYTIGKTLGVFQRTTQEMEEISTFKRKIRHYRPDRQVSTPTEQNTFDKLERVAALKASIFKRMKNDVLWNLSAAVALAVAGTFVVIGALAASYGCMTVGAVLGLGTGAVVLFKCGYDSTHERQSRDARRILSMA